MVFRPLLPRLATGAIRKHQQRHFFVDSGGNEAQLVDEFSCRRTASIPLEGSEPIARIYKVRAGPLDGQWLDGARRPGLVGKGFSGVSQRSASK